MNAPPDLMEKINQALGNDPVSIGSERSKQMDQQNFENQMTNLFAILDTDESKTLSIEEFCSGIARVMNGTLEQDRHTMMKLEKLTSDIAGCLGLGVPRQARADLRLKIKEELLSRSSFSSYG